jgi:acyl carrier protein
MCPPETPEHPPSDNLMAEIIQLLRIMAPVGSEITPKTRILGDLDMDSLKMLELIDVLKARHGVDFLQEPHSLASLETPETLVAALAAAKR